MWREFFSVQVHAKSFRCMAHASDSTAFTCSTCHAGLHRRLRSPRQPVTRLPALCARAPAPLRGQPPPPRPRGCVTSGPAPPRRPRAATAQKVPCACSAFSCFVGYLACIRVVRARGRGGEREREGGRGRARGRGRGRGGERGKRVSSSFQKGHLIYFFDIANSISNKVEIHKGDEMNVPFKK